MPEFDFWWNESLNLLDIFLDGVLPFKPSHGIEPLVARHLPLDASEREPLLSLVDGDAVQPGVLVIVGHNANSFLVDLILFKLLLLLGLLDLLEPPEQIACQELSNFRHLIISNGSSSIRGPHIGGTSTLLGTVSVVFSDLFIVGIGIAAAVVFFLIHLVVAKFEIK